MMNTISICLASALSFRTNGFEKFVTSCLLLMSVGSMALSVDPGSTQVIATGGTIQLGGTPTASGGSPPYTYSWQANGLGASVSNQSNPMVSPVESTFYTVTVTDNDGASCSASIEIKVIEMLIHNDQNPTWGVSGDSDDLLRVGNMKGISTTELSRVAGIHYTLRPEHIELEWRKLQVKSGGVLIREWVDDEFPEGERRFINWLGKKGETGTASSGASGTSGVLPNLTDNTKSWGQDQWKGGMVMITSGTGVGQTRAVVVNSATQLAVKPDWDITPDNTSQYFVGKYEAHEEYEVTLSVKIQGSGQVVESNIHKLADLAVRHKPIIGLFENEYSPPVDVDFYLEHSRLLNFPNLSFQKTNPLDIHTLLEDNQNTEHRYILDCLDPGDAAHGQANFTASTIDYRMGSSGLITSLGYTPTVYIRHKVEESPGGTQYSFIQYWMFYPASSLPVDDDDGVLPSAQKVKDDLCHEGDWEMLMVCVEHDVNNRQLKPFGIYTNAHYYGYAINWDAPSGSNNWVAGNDYVKKTGNRPNIWIAGGSHAGFLDDRTSLNIRNGITVQYGNEEYGLYRTTSTRDEYTSKIFESGGWSDASPADIVGQGQVMTNYTLTPLEYYGIWRGLWGMDERVICDEGPHSPQYRSQDENGSNTTGTSMWDNLIQLYNKFRKQPTTEFPGTGSEID